MLQEVRAGGPGGPLAYATCTLKPGENTDTVNDFMTRHRAAGAVAAELATAQGD